MTEVHPLSPEVGQDSGTPLGLAALLAGTLVGTASNDVVNVPLDAILDEFHPPLGSGVFVVAGFLLALAATIPLAGTSATGSAVGGSTARRCLAPRCAPSVRRRRPRCRC